MDKKEKVQRTALKITRWVGSLQSIFIHTLVFIASFIAVALGVLPFDRMLLVLTTVLSIEAIYLALFIQLTVNAHADSLEEVGHDIDEIQEDIDEIQENVGEIQEDVDELQEDVEEMSEEEKQDNLRKSEQKKTLEELHVGLAKLMKDLENIQNRS